MPSTSRSSRRRLESRRSEKTDDGSSVSSSLMSTDLQKEEEVEEEEEEWNRVLETLRSNPSSVLEEAIQSAQTSHSLFRALSFLATSTILDSSASQQRFIQKWGSALVLVAQSGARFLTSSKHSSNEDLEQAIILASTLLLEGKHLLRCGPYDIERLSLSILSRIAESQNPKNAVVPLEKVIQSLFRSRSASHGSDIPGSDPSSDPQIAPLLLASWKQLLVIVSKTKIPEYIENIIVALQKADEWKTLLDSDTQVRDGDALCRLALKVASVYQTDVNRGHASVLWSIAVKFSLNSQHCDWLLLGKHFHRAAIQDPLLVSESIGILEAEGIHVLEAVFQHVCFRKVEKDSKSPIELDVWKVFRGIDDCLQKAAADHVLVSKNSSILEMTSGEYSDSEFSILQFYLSLWIWSVEMRRKKDTQIVEQISELLSYSVQMVAQLQNISASCIESLSSTSRENISELCSALTKFCSSFSFMLGSRSLRRGLSALHSSITGIEKTQEYYPRLQQICSSFFTSLNDLVIVLSSSHSWISWSDRDFDLLLRYFVDALHAYSDVTSLCCDEDMQTCTNLLNVLSSFFSDTSYSQFSHLSAIARDDFLKNEIAAAAFNVGVRLLRGTSSNFGTASEFFSLALSISYALLSSSRCSDSSVFSSCQKRVATCRTALSRCFEASGDFFRALQVAQESVVDFMAQNAHSSLVSKHALRLVRELAKRMVRYAQGSKDSASPVCSEKLHDGGGLCVPLCEVGIAAPTVVHVVGYACMLLARVLSRSDSCSVSEILIVDYIRKEVDLLFRMAPLEDSSFEALRQSKTLALVVDLRDVLLSQRYTQHADLLEVFCAKFSPVLLPASVDKIDSSSFLRESIDLCDAAASILEKACTSPTSVESSSGSHSRIFVECELVGCYSRRASLLQQFGSLSSKNLFDPRSFSRSDSENAGDGSVDETDVCITFSTTVPTSNNRLELIFEDSCDAGGELLGNSLLERPSSSRFDLELEDSSDDGFRDCPPTLLANENNEEEREERILLEGSRSSISSSDKIPVSREDEIVKSSKKSNTSRIGTRSSRKRSTKVVSFVRQLLDQLHWSEESLIGDDFFLSPKKSAASYRSCKEVFETPTPPSTFSFECIARFEEVGFCKRIESTSKPRRKKDVGEGDSGVIHLLAPAISIALSKADFYGVSEVASHLFHIVSSNLLGSTRSDEDGDVFSHDLFSVYQTILFPLLWSAELCATSFSSSSIEIVLLSLVCGFAELAVESCPDDDVEEHSVDILLLFLHLADRMLSFQFSKDLIVFCLQQCRIKMNEMVSSARFSKEKIESLLDILELRMDSTVSSDILKKADQSVKIALLFLRPELPSTSDHLSLMLYWNSICLAEACGMLPICLEHLQTFLSLCSSVSSTSANILSTSSILTGIRRGPCYVLDTLSMFARITHQAGYASEPLSFASKHLELCLGAGAFPRLSESLFECFRISLYQESYNLASHALDASFGILWFQLCMERILVACDPCDKQEKARISLFEEDFESSLSVRFLKFLFLLIDTLLCTSKRRESSSVDRHVIGSPDDLTDSYHSCIESLTQITNTRESSSTMLGSAHGTSALDMFSLIAKIALESPHSENRDFGPSYCGIDLLSSQSHYTPRLACTILLSRGLIAMGEFQRAFSFLADVVDQVDHSQFSIIDLHLFIESKFLLMSLCIPRGVFPPGWRYGEDSLNENIDTLSDSLSKISVSRSRKKSKSKTLPMVSESSSRYLDDQSWKKCEELHDSLLDVLSKSPYHHTISVTAIARLRFLHARRVGFGDRISTALNLSFVNPAVEHYISLSEHSDPIRDIQASDSLGIWKLAPDEIKRLPDHLTIVFDRESNLTFLSRWIACQETFEPVLAVENGSDVNRIFHRIEGILDPKSHLQDSSYPSDSLSITNSQWWKERRAADDDLRLLLEDLNGWLGWRKSLFVGCFCDKSVEESFMVYSRLLSSQLSKIGLKSPPFSELFLFLRSIPVLMDDDSDLMSFLDHFSCVSSTGDDSDERSESSVRLLFRKYFSAAISKGCGLSARTTFEDAVECWRTLPRCCLFLVTSKEVHGIPWESLPVCEDQPISRLPSLSHTLRMVQMGIWDSTVNAQKAYYCLDPEDNLERTQARFKEWLRSQSTWNGTIGVPPPTDVVAQFFPHVDVLLYFGHGAGDRYFRRELVSRSTRSVSVSSSDIDATSSVSSSKLSSTNTAPVALLIGCGSGRIVYRGESLGWGSPWAYFAGGSPGIVGALWDVTDRDIDRFTASLLCRWMSSTTSGDSLPEAVLRARKKCKLRYLNGAACICYGAPVHVQTGTQVPGDMLEEFLSDDDAAKKRLAF